MFLFPKNGSNTGAHPSFLWYEWRYAAISSLSFDIGNFVSGRLSCALVPGKTKSFHLFKDWLIISVVDIN
jgi:hypothetical protein